MTTNHKYYPDIYSFIDLHFSFLVKCTLIRYLLQGLDLKYSSINSTLIASLGLLYIWEWKIDFITLDFPRVQLSWISSFRFFFKPPQFVNSLGHEFTCLDLILYWILRPSRSKGNLKGCSKSPNLGRDLKFLSLWRESSTKHTRERSLVAVDQLQIGRSDSWGFFCCDWRFEAWQASTSSRFSKYMSLVSFYLLFHSEFHYC